MVSRYDAVLMAIPASVLGGIGGEYVASQLPLATPLEQLPLTVVGLVVALALIGHELTDPPVD